MLEVFELHLASADTNDLVVRSALQALLQKIGLVTPYDLQHVLEQNNIELGGKHKRKQLEELSDKTSSKLVYGNVNWDSILYPYVLTPKIFEHIRSIMWKFIDRLKGEFNVSRKEMCSILIGILVLSFKKRSDESSDHRDRIKE